MKKKIKIEKPVRSDKKPVLISTSSFDRRYYYAIFIVALITFLVYCPSLRNGFVWDDHDYIINNNLIRDFNLKNIFSNYVVGNYHPITILIYACEFCFFNISEKGYHFINLIVHLLNTSLVFYVILLLSGKKEVALVACALFGIHPIHVESVVWVSELKDLLYTFFFLSSYIFYIKFIKSKKQKYYYLSILLFLFSLLSKAMAASLPVLLILTDFFIGNKINYKSLLNKIPYFILALIFGIVAIHAQVDLGATHFVEFPFYQRIIFACYSYITYLAKLFVPINFCAYYAYPINSGQDFPGHYFGFLFLVMGLAAYAIYTLRFSKLFFFALGFFTITIFLVLQFVSVGGAIMADRYSYIPSIGIFYLVGEGVIWLWNKKNHKVLIASMFFITIVLLSMKTIGQCRIWKDGMTLWNDVINQYQTVPLAYNNRALILESQNKYEEALNDYNKAISLAPGHSVFYCNRGLLKKNINKYDDALNDFNKAIALNSKNLASYINRGLLFNQLKKYDQALNDYNKALELNSSFVEAYTSRGVTFRNLKRYEESLSDFNKAIQLQPLSYKIYNERALLMANQNKFDLAMKDYTKAIQIQPDYVNGYLNRAILLETNQMWNESLRDYNEAARLDPENPKIYYNRGNLMTDQKRYEEAIWDYNSAIKIKKDYAMAYYGRGMAKCNSGKKDAGCTDLQTAFNLGYKPASGSYQMFCQ